MVAGFAIWTLVASFITAGLYWWDKRAARQEQRRVSESTLLGWSLIGGWPGGLLMAKLIRHKTQKLSYRIQFFLAALVNVLVLASVLYFSQG